MTKQGRFLVVEGVDGAGKSSHLDVIANHLNAHGIEVVVTREPGGTPLGETLRDVVLHHDMSAQAEALLMFAARKEHIDQVIMPALQAGSWVLSDRYVDASFAYQGAGRELGQDWIQTLCDQIDAPVPDFTWYFDVPVSVSQERLRKTRDMDRFETSGEAFFNRVRTAYLERATSAPAGRYGIVDATQSMEDVRDAVIHHLDYLIWKWEDVSRHIERQTA